MDTAMPDVCYEKCKTAVDAVKSRVDVCEGAALQNALACLEDAGMACSTSVFSTQHTNECNGLDSNATVRTLEESGDAVVELLVNETPKTVADSRNLALIMKCPRKLWSIPIPDGVYRAVPTHKGLAECIRFDYDPLVKSPVDFRLIIGWMRMDTQWEVDVTGSVSAAKRFKDGQGDLRAVGEEAEFKRKTDGHHAIWLTLQACLDVVKLFQLEPLPIYVEMCQGGRIEFAFGGGCPDIMRGMIIKGAAFQTFGVGFDFWICRIVIVNLELGFEAGIEEGKLEVECWWYHTHGPGRRRSWVRRRRRWRQCNWKEICDVYVKGYVIITLVIARATAEFKYYVKNKVLQIWIKLAAWCWKWYEVVHWCLYQRDFNK